MLALVENGFQIPSRAWREAGQAVSRLERRVRKARTESKAYAGLVAERQGTRAGCLDL